MKTIITIEIEKDNSVFDEPNGYEEEKTLLLRCVDSIMEGNDTIRLLDTNGNTVYNTNGRSEDGTDYSIEIVNGGYEVRHTGNTIVLPNIDEVLIYIA